MSHFSFTAEPFKPPFYLRNSHTQTLIGAYIRADHGVTWRRVRLDTPDKDFLDLDFAEVEGMEWKKLGDQAPILLLLHGLEGNIQKSYAVDIFKEAARAGIRGVGMNFRSCSGPMNKQPRFYHMGETSDPDFVLNWLETQYPNVPKLIAGVSLGGNVMLKLLGEHGDAMRSRVVAGVAVSPPFVATGKQALNYGLSLNYSAYLLRKLKRKVRLKAHLLEHTPADIPRALRANTLREFDESITAPVHGFANADDYYDKSNSVRFLAGIRVPTLLIRSQDDPFFNADIPYDIIHHNPHLYTAFPAWGGHVGFIGGIHPHQHAWMPRQLVRFFTHALQA